MSVRFKILLFSLVIFAFACENQKVSEGAGNQVILVECNAEKMEGDFFLDDSENFKLTNAKGRTTDEKRSGEYSLKLTKDVPYGMTIVLEDVNPNDYLKVTAWAKGDGHICASDDLPGGFYKATNQIGVTDSLGWHQLSLEFYIPNNYKSDKLKILLANFGDGLVYFDDYKLIKANKKQFPKFDETAVMNIFISDENFAKLSAKRDEAIKEGLLTTGEDDWVKAIIFYENKVLDTRVRLKGDRLDHLRGNKWSFRIKIKGDNAWKGMKTFSIQTPSARNYLHEWVFHQALNKEDILCTRYGFVPVTINGTSVGIYAWEEHFEKHLVESRKRREGPILKLSDESYWILDKLRRQKELDYSVPSYDASIILPFDQNGVTSDSTMLKEFEHGRDLYHQYKYARAKASDIFDVETAAKYYAMADATNAYHTLHFFNQRFYYNPVLGKLEPIFFDSFADVGIFDYDGTDLIVSKAEKYWLSIHLKLYADPQFKEMYFSYLEKYSSQKYWEDLYSENKTSIDELNNRLNREFQDYNFDINTFYGIAEKARLALDTIKEIDQKNDLFSKFGDRSSGVNTNYKGKADFELLPHLINVYKQSETSFRVENYTTDSIKIIGFSDIKQLESEKLAAEISLAPANSKKEYAVEVQSKLKKHLFLFVEVRGEKLSIPIIPWAVPNDKPKFQDVLNSFHLDELQASGSVEVKSDTLNFYGDIKIDQHLVIPDDWIITFRKGTSVDITNGATFVSYSPVFIEGTATEPVVFSSSDHSSKGFNVFQAKQKSKVANAVFTGLGNLEFGGWLTTGAVCFYESDVEFRNTKFRKNIGCDDALNIVRSDYLIDSCIFEDTFADAFDSDFCTGQILSTRFISPGNDAIDFSGSLVTIENSFVKDAGDKSVSCGEKSNITIRNCNFDGGNIGVASKDNSDVSVEKTAIKNVMYGLVAFCKKPEYGPARITTEKLDLKKYLFVHLIEEGSTLNFNKREIFGQERNVADRFY